MDSPQRIGVFGGTFDPIHRGHIEAAYTAMKNFNLDQILFVPARVSPHKTGEETKPTSFHHRAAMVEMTIQSEPKFKLDIREGLRTQVSYTIDTLRELSTEIPEAKLFLIIGRDQAKVFHTWHLPEEIKQLATLIEIPRESNGLSATKIRELAKNQQPLNGLVNPKVQGYIETLQIYKI